MSTLIEALLTIIANVGGYALAAIVVVHSARRARARAERWGFGDAGLALFVLWVLTMIWYVATVFWSDSYPEHSIPPWLESSEGAAENIQSEVFQVWLASLVFKHARWPGSPESQ